MVVPTRRNRAPVVSLLSPQGFRIIWTPAEPGNIFISPTCSQLMPRAEDWDWSGKSEAYSGTGLPGTPALHIPTLMAITVTTLPSSQPR